jgi:hypothetical protein
MVVGKKTYPLPKEIASVMIAFTVANGFENYPYHNPLKFNGVTLTFGDYKFVIDYKKMKFCILPNEVLHLIDMYNKMGIPFPPLSFDESSFKQKTKNVLSQGVESLGLKQPKTFERFARPKPKSSIRSSLEKLGLKRRNGD